MPSKLGKLPKRCFSLLGPLPVSLDPTLEDRNGALGLTNLNDRTITIQAGISPVTALQTFFHEMTHIALWDGGVNSQLTESLAETLCDVMGTFLAAALQAGYLRIKV